MTTPRIFVPRDAGALALGADEVERAIVAAERSAGSTLDIVRTGSRGLYWLEPMIEVATRARPHRLRPGEARAMSSRCSMPACSMAGRIRCASAGRKSFRS